MLPEGGWVLGFPDAGPIFRRVGKKDEALYLWLQIVFQPLNPPVSETFRSKLWVGGTSKYATGPGQLQAKRKCL